MIPQLYQMRITFLKEVVLSVLLLSSVNAQSVDVRSSLKELNTDLLNNPEEVNTFIMGFYQESEYDSVRFYAELYYQLAESKGNTTHKLEALFLLGRGLSGLDMEAFKTVSNQLLRSAKRAENSLFIARGYKYLSDYYFNYSVTDSTLYYLEKAESVASSDNNFRSDSLLQTLVGQFRHNRASVYYRQQMFDDAIELALDNRDYAIRISDVDLEMRSYQVLAASYSALVSYGEETGAEIETELYLERSKEFARLFVNAANQTQNDYLKGFAYATLANMHSMQNELDSALINYQRSLEFAFKQKDYAIYSSRLNNIGNIHSQLGQLELANDKYVESYQVAVDLGNAVLQARAANNISYTALQLNDLNRAKNFALIGIRLGEQLGRYGTISQSYGNLSEIEQRLGNTEAALEAYKSHIQFRDSLLKAENLQRIEDLQTKYETEKKQTEIDFLQKESRLQAALIKTRNTQIISVGLLLILIVTGGYMLYQRRVSKQQRELQDMHQRLLSVQMNPHFLFNALVSIQSFVLQNREVKDTSNFVAKFAKVTRMVLNYSREPFITLNQELELLKEFLRLQQIRTGNTFDYNFAIDENIQTDSILIPPMLAQPFIENAVEHGILPKQDERGKIDIEIVKKEAHLAILVRDNGAGFKKGDGLTSKKSLAIKITGERFELLKKITGKPYSFTIKSPDRSSDNRGVEVEFCIPVVS